MFPAGVKELQEGPETRVLARPGLHCGVLESM